MFYYIWIPYYAHVADPLYCLLRKGQNFLDEGAKQCNEEDEEISFFCHLH